MQNNLRLPGSFFQAVLFVAMVTALLAGMGWAQADPTAPTSPAPSSVTVSATYRLSPYDVIDVSVYGEDDLHTQARLGADGTVLLPLIGAISIGGETVAEANESIRKHYADGFVKDPHILVTVLSYRKSTFSILGQVSRAGIYEIPEGTRMSIVDAVLLAGGFTRLAAENSVTVKRTVKGKPVVFKVKVGEMTDSPDVPPFYIEAGDVINVRESWL